MFFLFDYLQQLKREKTLKEELRRELESKELEMQLLLQKQKSVRFTFDICKEHIDQFYNTEDFN